MMRYLRLGSDGALEAILNEQSEGLVECEVPDSYPETAAWDASTGSFVEDLAKHQARLWDEVKRIRDAREFGTAMTPFGAVEADERSKTRIAGLAQTATLLKASGQSRTFHWTMSDNQVVALDCDQAIVMGLAVSAHVDACFARARSLREQIASAASLDELAVIDIEEGWDAGAL